MKEIYLSCSDFMQFGYHGKCCPHGSCHEDHWTPPQKGNGSEPIVQTTSCCNFPDELITRDNCAKLAREYRKQHAIWQKKRRLEEWLVKSAVRLADARLKTWARSAPGELTLEAAREEKEAVEQYQGAMTASRVAWQKEHI